MSECVAHYYVSSEGQVFQMVDPNKEKKMGLKALQKALKNKVADEFENGDVIRWTAAGFYTYAAVKTPVGWFTTANNNAFVPNVVQFDDLVEILQRSETTDIELAVTWITVA